jgi:hypothetical protein
MSITFTKRVYDNIIAINEPNKFNELLEWLTSCREMRKVDAFRDHL